MSPKGLPGDVLYIIFGLLEPHKDLPDCTLVSRAWLFPSRRHLFRRIRIINNDPKPKRNLLGFLEFLRHSPHVREDIRNLDITNSFLPHGPQFNVQLGDLSEILENLPYLRSLTLHGLRFLECRCPEKLISKPFALEELVVSGERKEVGANGSLVTLLSLFSDVERLHVNNILEETKILKDFKQQTGSFKPPPWLRVRSLQTEFLTHEGILFAVIKNTPSSQWITSLDVMCPRIKDRAYFISLLKVVGPQIRDLRMIVRDFIIYGRKG